MDYKYEIHCHTKDVSVCGHVPAEEMVKLYKEAGYDGIVITDHYSPATFPFQEQISKTRACEHYLKGYRKAKALEDENFTVLLGMELRYYATVNDYLIYGLTEEKLKKLPHMMALYTKQGYKAMKKEGLLVIQAHPFRKFIYRANPKYLDGVEVYNGKTDKELNDKALDWANSFTKAAIKVGGSDAHRESQICTSGIITHEKIRTSEDLVRILQSGDFEIIKNAY